MKVILAFLLLCSNVGAFAPSIKSFFRNVRLSMVTTIDVAMPALSSTMTEGKIVSWNKKIGDKVNAGDVLLVVESDKADMDVEAFEDGFLAAIYTPEGGSAKVGAPVAALVANKDDIGKVGSAPAAPAASAPATVAASAPVAAAPVAASAGAMPAGSSAVNMPALSSTMTEGKIVSWSKKVGDKVSSGDMVLIVESDKADMDVESYEEGFLAAIMVGDGQSAAVGAPVALLAKTKDDIPAVQAYAASLKAGGAPAAVAPVAAAPAAAAPVAVAAAATPVAAGGYTPAAGTINATPTARKLAQENNLDVTKIKVDIHANSLSYTLLTHPNTP